MPIFNLIIIIISFNVLIVLHPISSTEHTPTYVHFECPRGDATYASGSAFESNLTHVLLDVLPANVSVGTVSKLTAGEDGVDQVNALSYCRGDVSDRECQDCVEAAARTVIQRCRKFKQGIAWYKECTVRYASRSNMFDVDELEVTPNHSHYNFSGTFRHLEQNEGIFNSLMNRLIHEAAYVGNGSGFATGESNLSTSNWVLHGLVQCRPDIRSDHCETCLRQALRQKDGWNTPMVFLPSCSIQFDMYPSADISTPSQGGGDIPIQVIVPAVVGCALVVCCIIFLVIRYRRLPPLQEQADYPRKYAWLKLYWATACFSKSRILGSGGFGHVYQGTLSDGTQVAVKRLNVSSSLQGNDQFVAEVEAISNLKHHNIVSLKGYCIFFRERLLVYEYVSNKTLEHHLRDNGQEFSWEKRLRTALSLAEVFAFMHDRNHAIVHRDIKPSNILMDDELQPKVGDFGIAKCFHQNQSHVTTMVKGSLGYMDPSYYRSEHLTTKSDVFAFGVVLLELITGRKAINESRQHITDWAGPLIEEAISEGKFDGLVDENLGTTYDHDQMQCMIICAATCVRISPEERPTMRQVVELLEGSKESNERTLELRQRLLTIFSQHEIQRRIYGEFSLDSSPSTATGQSTNNGCFHREIPTTDQYVSLPDLESQEFYFTASPTSIPRKYFT